MSNKNLSQWLHCTFFWVAVFFCGSALAAQVAAPFTSGVRYDLTGKITGTILPDPDGSGPLLYPATRNTYQNGLLVKTESGQLSYWQDENTVPANWGGFAVETTNVLAYDNYGRKTVQAALDKQMAVKRLTQLNYDANGRVNCKAVRMDPAVYTPPTFSSLPDACSPLLTANGYDRVTRYTYDNLDQVLTETRAHNTTLTQVYVTNTYYPSTRLLKTQTDANGNKTELRYDTTGRLVRRVYPSKTLVGQLDETDYNSYTYDANSNLHVERKRSGATVTHTYDNNNRLITKDLSNNTYSADVFYNYDLRGLTLSSRFGSDSGQGITNTFDGFGNLASSTTTMGGTTRQLVYQYDDNGNRTRITHPDNAYFGYTFDGINRVDSATENASSLINLTYRPNGRRHTLLRAGSATTTYTFDDVRRLQSLGQDFSGTTDDVTNTFVYNPASQVTSLTINNNLFRYQENNNRPGSYTTNGLNQYTHIAGQPLGYDANANLINDGSTVYTYDMENRLVATSGTVTSSFTYDPLGRLHDVTISGTATRFLYDGDALVAEYNSAGALGRRYVHGDQVDEPWVQYNGANLNLERRYLHADHQGSIIGHSNYMGSAFNRLTYDAFGIPGSANTDRFGYTGQIWFKELGLFHYKARMYHPKLGRFLQTDPIFYADQMNMYAYVGNDPVNFNDPTGESRYQFAGSDKIDIALETIADAVVDEAVSRTDGGSVANSAAKHYQRSTETLRQARSSTLARNVATGKKGEAMTAAKLGDKVAGKQVTFKTSDGTRTRQDFVTKDKGTVETKTGDAQLSSGQQKFKDDVDAGREVTPVGANAEKAGLIPNQPTTMTSCTVDRPC